MSSFLLHVATLGCIYALMALGLNLQAGLAGLLNFGFIAFAGIGAYATAIVTGLGYPVLAGMLTGAVLAALVGMLMARLGRALGERVGGVLLPLVSSVEQPLRAFVDSNPLRAFHLVRRKSAVRTGSRPVAVRRGPDRFGGEAAREAISQR